MARPHVAILGGGLTGLSAAFHISRALPQARITLLEKSPRLGGWVRSERVQVEDKQGNSASVVLEAGPRTLRPNAQSVLELIHLLELKDETITTPKSSPSAKSRFLHFPPQRGLLPLPHSLVSLCTSPLAPLLFRAILTDIFRTPNRPQLDLSTSTLSKASSRNRRNWSDDKITDEAFHSFLSRRFGDVFATKFGSALVHGIYATDSRRLSVQAAFPSLWALEEKGRGRVALGVMREIRDSILKRKETDGKEGDTEKAERATRDTISAGPTVSGSSDPASTSETTFSQSWPWQVGMSPHDPLQKLWAEKIKGAAVLSFRDGMETLTRKLVKRLREREGVEIRVGDKGQVKTIKFDDTGKLELTVGSTIDSEVLRSDYIISAVPIPVLSQILINSHTSSSTNNLPLHSSDALNLLISLLSTPPSLSTTSPTSATSTSVLVLNLVFASSSSVPLHPPGFGYLIPRGPSDYHNAVKDGNDLGMLGVVFDSASVEGQQDYVISSTLRPSDHANMPPHSGDREVGRKTESKFVKITVMLGGPYPTGPLRELSEEELLRRVLNALQHQLGLAGPLPEPVFTKMWWNEGSIPVFGVGHVEWAEEVGRRVKEAFSTPLSLKTPAEASGAGGERLERMWVGGAGVSGVSVGDCIKSGREGARWVERMVRLEESRSLEDEAASKGLEIETEK